MHVVHVHSELECSGTDGTDLTAVLPQHTHAVVVASFSKVHAVHDHGDAGAVTGASNTRASPHVSHFNKWPSLCMVHAENIVHI